MIKQLLVCVLGVLLVGCATTTTTNPAVDATVMQQLLVQPDSNTQSSLLHIKLTGDLLSGQQKELLRQQAHKLIAMPTLQAYIVGHADAHLSHGYNLAIAFVAAQTVANYFAELGVPQVQLHIISYGAEQPRKMRALMGKEVTVKLINEDSNEKDK